MVAPVRLGHHHRRHPGAVDDQKWYANEEVDRLIVKGRETLDRAAREKVYQDLYRAMVEDPGYIFLHAQDSVWAKRASSDWSFNPFVGNASHTLFFK